MSPQYVHPDVGRVRSVLAALGLELPGWRLEQFAVSLLRELKASPSLPADALISRALRHVADGPVALVAEEPELRNRTLPVASFSVAEAAESAVVLLGRELLLRFRRELHE
jgi:hypothetical protein